MSSKQLLPFERENNSKGVATGTMKGTLKNLRTNISYPFLARSIWRDEQQGTLRFHGTMDDPETQGKLVAIGLQLSSSEQQSGTFPVGDSKILHLTFTQNGNDGDVHFSAESGEVVLQRKQFQKPINGRLVFKTKAVGDDRYDVDVIFDISEF
jgi:hypothetical protein